MPAYPNTLIYGRTADGENVPVLVEADGTVVTTGGGGGGTPGGSDTQLQYNNAGAFGGVPATWTAVGTKLELTGGFVATGGAGSYAGFPAALVVNTDPNLNWQLVITDPGAPDAFGIYSFSSGAFGFQSEDYATTGTSLTFGPNGMLVESNSRGTGAIAGKVLFAGRNMSGNGAAGALGLNNRLGTTRYVWADATDTLRVGSAMPTEDGSVSDTSGATLVALAGAVARGSTIVGNSTPAWSALTIGAAGTVLTSDGTDVSWQAPAAGITIGSTTITSGASGKLLYDNGGVVGETSGPTLDSLTMSGNLSSAAWTTNGIRYKSVAGTLTDTTSSGTVAAAYTNVLGGNTIAASSATTFTNYVGTYFRTPTAGTNVTLTNAYAAGADNLLLSSGTLTASKPALNITQTWNNAGVTFTAVSIDATNTASTGFNRFLDFKLAGSSVFRITTRGLETTSNYVLFNDGNPRIVFGRADFTTVNVGQNTPLTSDAANVLAQRNSTNAQTQVWANTWTNATNYEYGRAMWSSNVWHIGTTNAGTGTARVLQLDYGGTTTAAISVPITSGDVTIGGAVKVTSATMIKTATSFTDGAAAQAGTLTNAPAAGNPTKWIPIDDNGTTRYIPAW